MLCKLQRCSNRLHKVYEDRPQFKDLIDRQRAEITSETNLQTQDSGEKGGMDKEVGRSSQILN